MTDPSDPAYPFIEAANGKEARNRAWRARWGTERPWLSFVVGLVMLAAAVHVWLRADRLEALPVVLALAGAINLWQGVRVLRRKEQAE